MFKPRSIALIGASKTPNSVGSATARNLFKSAFEGPIMPVNPKHLSIEGVLTYPSVASLPITPDLAIITTPPETIPTIIDELGKRGTKAAVVITAGFGETGSETGKHLQKELLATARSYLLRIIGPNCLGIMVPGVGLNASFSHLPPQPGHIAFVAQSGAITTSIIDWAAQRNLGFSHLVSLGDMADVDFGDMLDYLANDPNTHAIFLYVEAITQARKFISAARAAARMKPTIVVKAGRHPAGAKAASSHTGALAGEDIIYDAVFRRAGLLRVISLEELFDAAEILALSSPPKGERLAILTNGGGIGVLATDHLMDEGGTLAELDDQTINALNQVLPKHWSHSNPIDIIGDANAERYQQSLEILMAAENIDGILVLNCPTAITAGLNIAEAVIATSKQNTHPVIITNWVGEYSASASRRLFNEHKIPSYPTPGQAVKAFMYQVRYRQRQDMLMQTPPSIPEEFFPDLTSAQKILTHALDEERSWLTDIETKRVLDCYSIPTIATYHCPSVNAVYEQALELSGPFVLKIYSPDIIHKSDCGGVTLNIVDAASVKIAAENMLKRLSVALPDARMNGFILQPMIDRTQGYELIVGIKVDPLFGPVIVFGQGGIAVEVLRDVAIGLPPLNMKLAHELVHSTRVVSLLKGYRGISAANFDAIALTLIKVSQMAIDLPELVEFDINPLLTINHHVVALDARMKIAKYAGLVHQRLAICPYPKELEESHDIDRNKFLVRPILPEDEPMLHQVFNLLTPEQTRFRFFITPKKISHLTAARFTQIDYDRDMAFVLTKPGVPGKTSIYGVVQLCSDPNLERAEYSIVVSHEMTKKGVGTMLMRKMISYAKLRSIKEIYGDVTHDNITMLKICRTLGFQQTSSPDSPGVIHVSLKFGS